MVAYGNNVELIHLVTALCDGEILHDELTKLDRLLLGDAASRQFYYDYVTLHAELAYSSAAAEGKGVRYILPERPEGCFAQNVPDPFSFVGTIRWTRDYFSQPGPLSMLVAAIFMVCMISLLSILPAPIYQQSRSNHACNTSISSPGRQPRDKAKKLNLVARITGKHNCRWSAEGRAPFSYDHLGLGRELKLDSGMVEITYYNGAKVVLEGPVEFTVEQANACLLDVGKLTANVPKPAVGFTVETPSATVVDLGTEFGVTADRHGETEVHVFRGVVEAKLDGRTGPAIKRRLSAGTAVRFAADGAKVTNIFLNVKRFTRVQRFAARFTRARRIATEILHTSGDVKFVDIVPWSVVPGSFEDSRHIILFPERENVLLQRDLEVTIASPGTYTSVNGYRAAIPAGTRVHSYLLHFDPIGEMVEGVSRRGSLTTINPILGVIVHDTGLDASDDDVGRMNIIYPIGTADRGTELDPGSSNNALSYDAHNFEKKITLSADRRTLTIDRLIAGTSIDQIRVLIAAPATKERQTKPH